MQLLNMPFLSATTTLIVWLPPETGEALEENVGPAEEVPHEEAWITSKLRNTKHHPEDVEDIGAAFQTTMLISSGSIWICSLCLQGGRQFLFPRVPVQPSDMTLPTTHGD